MHASTFLIVATASFLLSVSAFVIRDAGTTLLVNDLLRLDQAIRNITYAAGNYTGGQAAYQPIRDSFAQVNYTNRIAYYDAMKIEPRRSSLIR